MTRTDRGKLKYLGKKKKCRNAILSTTKSTRIGLASSSGKHMLRSGQPNTRTREMCNVVRPLVDIGNAVLYGRYLYCAVLPRRGLG